MPVPLVPTAIAATKPVVKAVGSLGSAVSGLIGLFRKKAPPTALPASSGSAVAERTALDEAWNRAIRGRSPEAFAFLQAVANGGGPNAERARLNVTDVLSRGWYGGSLSPEGQEYVRSGRAQANNDDTVNWGQYDHLPPPSPSMGGGISAAPAGVPVVVWVILAVVVVLFFLKGR